MIQTIDYDAFRRELAGLIDPLDRGEQSPIERTTIRMHAVEFGIVLCELFSSALDRITLWDRIGSAFATACAKVSDDDLDRWCDLCLEHVKADPGRAAANDRLSRLRDLWHTSWDAEARFAYLDYFRAHPFAVLSHTRAEWDKTKAANNAEREAKKVGGK